MLFSFFLSSLLITGVLNPFVGAGTPVDIESVVTGYFGAGAHVHQIDIHLTGAQRTAVGEECGRSFATAFPEIWQVSKDGKTLGFAFTDEVKGKVRNISYAVLFTPEGTIRGIEILRYRESHGGEVASSMFRSQFEGKSAADPLKVGKDIRNITGATISSRAVTGGVKALALLFRYLRKERLLGI